MVEGTAELYLRAGKPLLWHTSVPARLSMLTGHMQAQVCKIPLPPCVPFKVLFSVYMCRPHLVTQAVSSISEYLSRALLKTLHMKGVSHGSFLSGGLFVRPLHDIKSRSSLSTDLSGDSGPFSANKLIAFQTRRGGLSCLDKQLKVSCVNFYCCHISP